MIKLIQFFTLLPLYDTHTLPGTLKALCLPASPDFSSDVIFEYTYNEKLSGGVKTYFFLVCRKNLIHYAWITHLFILGLRTKPANKLCCHLK